MDKWIRSRADEYAVDEGCTFDERAAERVRRFFLKYLRHSKGEWARKPFELLPWQWDELIAPLFGWKRADGTRRFRITYIELPKKQGKSTCAAGIGLYLLAADQEQGAEVYSTAVDREQAGIVHREAVLMAEASDALASYLHVNRTSFNILFKKTNSYYRALSSEAGSKEGLNAHGLIVDELHAWKGRALWDALKFAGSARRQPLRFVITTAGNDPLSVCREQHDYAKQVLSGAVRDTRFFALIKAADAVAEGALKDDDWNDPAVWKKANPSLGFTIKEDDFRADLDEAKRTPSSLSSFLRYRFNIWGTSTNPWLKLDDWQNCRAEFSETDLLGMECVGGLDLSKTQDMTAFVLIFKVDDKYKVFPYFWLPVECVDDPTKPEEYRVWARNGVLKTTPGNVCDYQLIKKDIGELAQKFQIAEFAYDPWNAEQFTQDLERENNMKRVAFSQTLANFTAPTKEFERLVISGELEHNGHPIMTWQAGHVMVKSDANQNIRPVKPDKNNHKKIDGIVAAVMALARGMIYWQGSVYERSGELTL